MHRLCIYKKKKKKVAWEKASDFNIHLKPSLYTAGFFVKDRQQPEQNQRNMHQSYFCKCQGQKTLQEKRNRTIFFFDGHLCTGRIKFFQKILARHVSGTWPQQRAKKAPAIRNEHTSVSQVSSRFFPGRSQQPPQPSTASAPLEKTSETNKFLQDLQTEMEWSLGKRPNKENGSLLIPSKAETHTTTLTPTHIYPSETGKR